MTGERVLPDSDTDLLQAFLASLEAVPPAVSDRADHMDVSGDHVLNPDFATHDPQRGLKPAAVLIVIGRDGAVPRVTLTLRNPALNAHAGQIAFPGGRLDPGEGVEEAALREAFEEIALDPAHVSVQGFLPSYASRTGYRVYPVVGIVERMPALKPNPGEVELIFDVPLRFLLDLRNATQESIMFAGKERYFYAYHYENYRIWGLTAGIIHHMSQRLLPDHKAG